MADRGVESRRLVRITTARGVREFVSGPSPMFGLPASVVTVSPRGSSIDPWTRALTISERHVRLKLDYAVRDMLASEHVAGCRVEVYLGAASLPRARWVREWFGQIVDAVPDGVTVVVRCGDIGSMLRATDVRGSWVAQHPLDVVSDVVSRGAAPTELYRAASFDRRLLVGQSHWALSRAGMDGPNVDPELATSPINAWTAIQEQIAMLGGALRLNADQALEYVPYDRRRPPVRHLTADKIGNFRVREIAGNRCDEMTFEFCRAGGAEPARYTVRVPGAAAEHRWEGFGERAASKTISLPWVHGRAEVDVDIPATGAGSTTFSIFEAERNGLCGFRFATFGSPQDAHDAVSADRRAYLLIESEIVEVLTINSVSGRSFRSGTFGVPGASPVFYPLNLEANITVSRGALGTSRVAHPWVQTLGIVHDVTIPVWMARDRARFAHGGAVVEFDVPLTEMEIELLDFLSFDRPSLVFRGCDGADSSHVWEVIDHVVDEGASPPCIHLVLLYAYHDTPTGEPVDNEVIEVVPSLPPRARTTAMSADEVNTRLVVDGLLPTIDSGRTILIPEGSIDGTAVSERNRAERSVELDASRDHYLRYNVRSRALEVVDVTVSAAAPVLRRGSVPIAMIRTDATSVVSITDMRPTRPLDGAQLVDSSVPSGRMVYPLDTEVSQLMGTQIGTSRAARRAGNVETTNATTTTVLSIPLASKTAGLLRIEIGASRFATDDSGAWRVTARVRHDGTAASVQASTAELTSTSDAAWAVSVTASGDNILVRVTGAASQTVRWTAAAELVVADAN